MKYKGYTLDWDGDEVLVFETESNALIGSEDTYKEAMNLVNEIVENNVNHESEL